MTQNIAILGASGYTGAELIRLIAGHSSMKITALGANSKAGQSMAEVFPHLRHMDLPTLCRIDEIDFGAVDLCFCALPHATICSFDGISPEMAEEASKPLLWNCSNVTLSPLSVTETSALGA